MYIIIVSDTHMPKRGKELPAPLICELEKADLIIHAGDWQTIEIAERLSGYAPVEGVYGNVDDDEIKARFPEKKLLTIEGKQIGVVHGHGTGRTTEKRALAAFTGVPLDLLIFGHSHIPVKKEQNGMMLFNPGSPVDKRRQPDYSFGICQISQGKMKVSHHFFGKQSI